MIRILAFAAALAAASPAFAQDVASFIVAADEGYGVDSCLGNAESCGAAVASGWCVASGYDHAIGYRPAVATDVTGAIGGSTLVASHDDNRAIVVTCAR